MRCKDSHISQEENMMFKYLVFIALGLLVAWLTNPTFLSNSSGPEVMLFKLAVFLIVFGVLTILTRKRR